jgi:hypothetical protein
VRRREMKVKKGGGRGMTYFRAAPGTLLNFGCTRACNSDPRGAEQLV